MLSGIITAILLVLFIVGWFWAWSPRRKKDFDEAARLALDDDDKPAPEKRADEQTDQHPGTFLNSTFVLRRGHRI